MKKAILITIVTLFAFTVNAQVKKKKASISPTPIAADTTKKAKVDSNANKPPQPKFFNITISDYDIVAIQQILEAYKDALMYSPSVDEKSKVVLYQRVELIKQDLMKRINAQIAPQLEAKAQNKPKTP